MVVVVKFKILAMAVGHCAGAFLQSGMTGRFRYQGCAVSRQRPIAP